MYFIIASSFPCSNEMKMCCVLYKKSIFMYLSSVQTVTLNVYENTNPKSNLRKCEYYKPLLNYFEQTDCRIHWIQQSKVS